MLAALAIVVVAFVAIGGWWLLKPSTQPPTPYIHPTTTLECCPSPTVRFAAGDIVIAEGECTTLEWDVSGAADVLLDDQDVAPTASRAACPTTTTHYRLVARTADGQNTVREVTVEVRQASLTGAGESNPESLTPTVSPTTEPSPATTVPDTPVPTTPPAPPTETVAPTEAVLVEFYPDNRMHEIPRSQLCTAVIWRTLGVTDIELERDGQGRKGVGKTGREEVCFGNDHVTMVLHFRLPEGTQDRRTVDIKKK